MQIKPAPRSHFHPIIGAIGIVDVSISDHISSECSIVVRSRRSSILDRVCQSQVFCCNSRVLFFDRLIKSADTSISVSYCGTTESFRRGKLFLKTLLRECHPRPVRGKRAGGGGILAMEGRFKPSRPICGSIAGNRRKRNRIAGNLAIGRSIVGHRRI
jgi:hypothetical protein